MAWIELHQNLLRHPKLIRLAVQLSTDKQHALWSLESLWLWAIDFASDGDLSDFSSPEIAAAGEWNGDPEIFLSALRDCGWMDKSKIHDWMEYAGRLAEKRAANKERMRNARASSVQRTNNARAGATVPNRTVPNQPEDPPQPPKGAETAWDDYLAMRRRIRKPATIRAQELVLSRLAKFSGGDTVATVAILEQSIINSWQNVFEVKTEVKNGRQHPGTESAAERNGRRFREELGKIATGVGAGGGDEILPLLPEVDA